MKLIQRLLKRTRPHFGQNRKIRGLSTAELVGIIVIVGILGALGGTYVNGLVSTANSNAGAQNANTLNTVAASVLSGGGTAALTEAAGQINVTDAATAIADLNAGVTTANGVLYKMTPPIAHPGSYTMTSSGSPVNSVVFSYTAGATP